MGATARWQADSGWSQKAFGKKYRSSWRSFVFIDRPVASGLLGIEGWRYMSKRFIGARQTTLAREVEVSGTGVHSGAPVSVVLHPADADTGFRFIVSKRGRIVLEIPADVSYVKNLTLCTVIGDEAGTTSARSSICSRRSAVCVSTTASSRSTAAKCRSWTGASAAFVEAIDEVGHPRASRRRANSSRFSSRSGSRRAIAGANFCPAFEFPSRCRDRLRQPRHRPSAPRARSQSRVPSATNCRRARTFGFMRDVEKLWKAGLALGASLDNTVAIGDDRIMNPEGLRYPHEFVRHKMLDAVGDLALAGAPILGAYRSVRGGHRLNAHVLKALFAGADGSTWRWERAPRVMREAAPIDISAGVIAVNYAADRS